MSDSACRNPASSKSREIATKNGALLIFDEVKTGAKLCWGGVQ